MMNRLVFILLPLLVTSFQSQPPNRPSAATSALFAQEDRRHFLSSLTFSAIGTLASPSLATAATTTIPTPAFTKDLSWPLGKVAFSLLPLAGTSTRRATVEEEIVPGKIWTHDQLQGIVNVNVPVRQTVIKLSPEAGGGLWIHNPVAPTPQLVTMMKRLEEQHGPIRHIVLGTVALEHKATFGAFARKFPNATVWIQPGQWSFPLGLDIETLGVTQRGARMREIPIAGQAVSSKLYEYYAKKNPVPEWAADFDWEVLGPLKFQSVGGFSETAFFHKPTKSLIVTDTVVSVTDTPPKIIAEDPRAMLFHARDSIDEIVQDTPENRKRGWRRMVQFGLVFFPSQIEVVPVGEALTEARNVDPSMRTLGEDAVPGSLYPWTWHANNVDQRSFDAISKKGALFCPPILTKLILDREPQRTIMWVDKVCQRFDFKRVIPGHLNNNLKAGPKEFSAAFDMLRSTPGKRYPQRPLPEDLALLQKASDLLTKFGVVGPSQVCDGEPARQKGRFTRSYSRELLPR
jgi:hypothetical protein